MIAAFDFLAQTIKTDITSTAASSVSTFAQPWFMGAYEAGDDTRTPVADPQTAVCQKI